MRVQDPDISKEVNTLTEQNMKFDTLEDFLIDSEITIDGKISPNASREFQVKGRLVKGAVLFADMRDFSKTTSELDAIETLILMNAFFNWLIPKSVRHSSLIIDKYIGDEVMMVFSEEFGANNHFIQALAVAMKMVEGDVFGFNPHVGISEGEISIGHVGTPKRFEATATGHSVTLAKRCGEENSDAFDGSLINLPLVNWVDNFGTGVGLQSVVKNQINDGEDFDLSVWDKEQTNPVDLKGLGSYKLIQLRKVEPNKTENIERAVKRWREQLEDENKIRTESKKQKKNN